jgi:hypothetical protein
MPFFLYRDGDDVKMAEGDYQVGSHLRHKGYELFSRPLFTTEEATTEERAWQERVDKMRATDYSDATRIEASVTSQ